MVGAQPAEPGERGWSAGGVLRCWRTVLPLVALSAAFSAAQPTILEPLRFEEPEQILGWQQVAGGIRKGLLLVDAGDGQVSLDALAVAVPETGGGPLCVIIDSRDGRYHAELEYQLASGPATSYHLAFPTQHVSTLAQYTARELGVLAYLSPECDPWIKEGDRIVAASWGGDLQSAETFLLLLNSAQATAVWVQDLDSGEFFPCEKVAGADLDVVESNAAGKTGPIFSYDMECRLSNRGGSALVEWHIVREYLGTNVDPIALRLYLP